MPSSTDAKDAPAPTVLCVEATPAFQCDDMEIDEGEKISEAPQDVPVPPSTDARDAPVPTVLGVEATPAPQCEDMEMD